MSNNPIISSNDYGISFLKQHANQHWSWEYPLKPIPNFGLFILSANYDGIPPLESDDDFESYEMPPLETIDKKRPCEYNGEHLNKKQRK